MRAFLALLLLLGGAAAQDQPPRTVADVVRDHALALGNAADVRTLKAVGTTSLPQRKPYRNVETYLRADGSCYRRHRRWSEYVVGGEVFSRIGRMFARFRPDQGSWRGAYYVQAALARPFPLLPLIREPGAQKGWRIGYTDRYEVLVGLPDRYGVFVQYMLDRKTHVLSVIRFMASETERVAALSFEQQHRVNGVMLPGAVRSIYWPLVEDTKKKGLARKQVQRLDQFLKWELNPDLGKISFHVPGDGGGGASGFERIELKTGIEPFETAVGDLDQDGRLDIAVACFGGISVHFGGALDAPVRVALGAGHHGGIVIEDLDRDGTPDIVTTSRVSPAQTFFFVRFDSHRKATVRKRPGAALFPHDLACADFDLDGIGDIVTSGWGDRRLYIDFGNGSGEFRFTGSWLPLANAKNPGPRGFGVAIGHLDADNLKDIAVADGTRVRLLMGRVNLSFKLGKPVTAGPRPVAVCLADLNRDGRSDLLVANDRPVRDLKGDIGILLNTGDGFKGDTYVEAGERVPAVAAGRFNNDLFVDAAAASFLTGEVTLLYGNGEGKLRAAERLASGRGTHRLLVTDFDGDGRDDILASNRLDDTIVLFLNRREVPRIQRPPPMRAIQRPASAPVAFRLEGLSDPYRFAGEFRIPANIQDPSGVAWLGGDPSQRQLVLVSDKESSIFRAVLDVQARRLLVGPRIPLARMGQRRLDLEAAAFDSWSGNLFLASESSSTVLRVTLFGDVLAEVETGIESGGNDGLEAIAFRRKKDGAPLLYAFRERIGKTLKRPPFRILDMQEDPFALSLRHQVEHLPYVTPDQTGAAVQGDHLFVVCRFLHRVIEFGFDGARLDPRSRSASFRELTEQLGLGSVFGMVEGIAVDAWGDLYLLLDNNRETIGKPGLNRSNEGRLLWFRNVGKRARRVVPRRVVVRHIHIPWQGALGGPKVKRTRAQAAQLAERIRRELKAGARFDDLADKYHYRGSPWPTRMRIVAPPQRIQPGEFGRDKLEPAFGRLAFALDVGEVEVCEFHHKESRYGYHVLLRIE